MNSLSEQEQADIMKGAAALDEYRLGKLTFTPDVIYDIGADFGTITLTAHGLYPEAKIIAVEPNLWSYPRLIKNTKNIPEIIPIRAALGQGKLYEAGPQTKPLHWMVVNRDAPTWRENLIPCDVPAVMLDDLYAKYGGENYVVKMDCESGEFAAINHEPSRQMIINSSFFAAELHLWGTTHEAMMEVVETTQKFLFLLAQTHTIYMKYYGACMHVWADKRIQGAVTGGDGVDG